MICLLVMYTNKGLRAAICPRQTKLSGLRSLRGKLSVEVRGGSGRWSAAGPSELVIPGSLASKCDRRRCNVSRQR